MAVALGVAVAVAVAMGIIGLEVLIHIMKLTI